MIGVAPQAKLMIIKVLDDKGAGTTGALAEGIRYAAANGARIINCSLGGDQNDPRMTAAVKAAGEANALVVGSAGNDGRDIDTHPNYPAAIPARNLVAVAATDPDDGPRHLELLQLRPPGGAGRRPRGGHPLDRQRRRLGDQVRDLDGRPDGQPAWPPWPPA